ncbi:MAG: MaoC family dehydratase [Candidatus Rokuibacteriota bacterium]
MAGSTVIEDLELGMAAELTRAYDEWDIYTFAAVTGDLNPAPVDQAFAEQTLFQGRFAHGMLTASLISAVIGTKLPGPGSIYLTQSLKFLRPVRVGDTVTARVAVIEIMREKNLVTLQTTCANHNEERLLEGTAVVMPPRVKVAEASEGRVSPETGGALARPRLRLGRMTEPPPRKKGSSSGHA